VAVPVGQAAPPLIACRICGCRYDVLGPCPQCGRLNREEARRIEEEMQRRKEEVEGPLREIEGFLASEE